MAGGVLEDCWYLVAQAHEVRRDRPLERRLAGRRLVLARDAEGRAFALDGLCPHRLMPLVHGHVEGGEVVCPYHGWRFDGGGRCTRVPAILDEEQPLAERLAIGTWPVAEADGLVWAFLASRAWGARPPPAMPYGTGRTRRPMLVREVEVPLDLDQANFGLLDPAHVTYVHRSWYWRKAAERRVKEKRFEPHPLGWQMARHRPSANSRAMKLLGGEASTEIRFQIPGVRTESIRFGAKEIVSLTAHTPTDAHTTMFRHFIWLPKGLRFAVLRPFLAWFGKRFIEQDVVAFRRLAEAGPDPGPRLLVGEVDHQFKWYRQVKDAYAAAPPADKPAVAAVLDREVLRWRT